MLLRFIRARVRFMVGLVMLVGVPSALAQAELSAICRAVGVMKPNDSVELHNLPLLVTVKCKKREDTGDIVNEVRGYAKKEAIDGTPQQETTDTPPWARR